ncbi:hypothetical protein CEE69_24030 [Rhodopirellula bahusiensis]|uniref:Uncharacterized protein n=1 Tax=Rhodopirellula bahusiensis TaxID=2014065 RepID=A0A2G1W0Y1_9BACT|nr:hypothetical protein CEE69_24030 [Rhodopirellula bahusiensis]
MFDELDLLPHLIGFNATTLMLQKTEFIFQRLQQGASFAVLLEDRLSSVECIEAELRFAKD